MKATPEAKGTIDFDDKSGRFVVSLPFWANDLLSDVPKRWSKPKRAWLVPAFRVNAQILRDKVVPLVNVTDGARKALDQAIKAAVPVKKGAGFPAWYKFKTEPRAHQRKAYDKFYGMKVMAFHADRGTGKSKMAIDMACAYRMDGIIDSLVIVCRLSLRRNWVGYDHGTGPGQREGLIGHAPIPFDVFLPDGGADKRFDRWMNRPHDFKVLIIGTESLSQGSTVKMLEKFLSGHAHPMMLIDESHDIMNHKAVRSQHCVELGQHHAEVRATLTGTPTSTGPMNLFMQFEFLDPNIIGLGDYYAFRNRYAVMGGYMKEVRPGVKQPMEIVGYQNMDELSKLVAPYVFEVRKADVLDLPPKIPEIRYVQLTKEQRDLYNRVKGEKAYEWAGKEVVVQNVLELALRLHQIAGGFITTYEEVKSLKRDGTPKIKKIGTWHEIIKPDKNPKISELVKIGEEDKQMVIWCAYRPEIQAVVETLGKVYPHETIREMHGGISESDRHTFKNEFQSGKAKFLVGNTQTGGVGLTLTAAEIMVYLSNTEKMIDREQSEDRAHRDGLQHSVLYVDLIAEKTVDELILASIQRKVDLAEYLRLTIRKASDLYEAL